MKVQSSVSVHSPKSMKHFLVLLTSVFVTVPAAAQYKCKLPGGGTTYQQTPCPFDGAQEKIRVFASPSEGAASATQPNYKAQLAELDRTRLIREAIAARRPMITMTREELDSAMGPPDKINAAQYGAVTQDQMTYFRGGRTFLVYAENGVVTAIQDNDGAPSAARRPSCPTPKDIRDIEIEKSKIANRENEALQADLSQRIRDAKACR